jgi:GDP-mannose 6-dehydrogenase
MRISIFGLGYVGAVSAACLASEGHDVTGVDKNATKLDLINAGRTPIIEEGVDELIAEAHEAGRLRATDDATAAVRDTELSLVCVGTPSEHNGNLDLRFVHNVCREIGAALADKDDYHIVVIRSTILPGTMRDVVLPALVEASGKSLGDGFGVCFNPEFLREGSAVKDYYDPPKTVIGESDPRAGDALVSLYEKLDAEVFRTSLETAEMVKYVDNTWHALKVGFANEIGSVAKALGIDSHKVMEIFVADTKLNLSPYYLKPGFAFGGSCLPKDVRALKYRARTLDIEAPILESILTSNSAHIQRGLDMVLSRGKKKVGILGFSFKAGTDDLRESPLVEMIERLIGKGFDLALYDHNVSLARLTGANRDYILHHIPHIAELMRDDIDSVLEHAEVIVLGNANPAFGSIFDRLRPDQEVIDLVRLGEQRDKGTRYEGICW